MSFYVFIFLDVLRISILTQQTKSLIDRTSYGSKKVDDDV